MSNKKFLIALLILAAGLIIFSEVSYSQQEGDRIIAIVGNQIILESDLQYQVQLYMRQNQISQLNPAMINQIFQQLINEKIIIAKADQDSIEIKSEEINKELDYRLKSLLEQYGSEDRIEEVYGMSLGKIRILLRDDLSNKMKSERMKRKKFPGGVKVTDREIRDFYNTYGDSLPMASNEYEISHIFILRTVTEDEKKLAYEKALLIMDSVKQGVDFGELAKRNSSDVQSASQNGDLGYAKKGIFVKEFEEELFSLNEVGEISQIVETQYGYHIIKLTDKRGDQRRSSHILIPYPKLESNDFQTIALLKDIKSKILSNEITFEDAAKKYSQEDETKEKNGYLGFVGEERLDSNIIEVLKKLSPDEITDPVRIGDNENYGYEIVKLISINPAHKLTLETDYEKIKKFTEYEKETKELGKWIEELKKSIYVDIKF
jgi:peptidyl-prolyl cis-trans isomerase SurA